ncbi:MAG: hypothetical protein HQL08_15040 [Nitrospirae bacterium]|nr:hypothetical protein [Nitrospirota bacterium]
MERTIIFRVWDIKSRRMLDLPAGNINFAEWWKEHCARNPQIENEIIYMQFTGVYDRSRREIFEGDIIDYHSPAGTHERAVVHYITRYACFGVREDIPLRNIPHFEVIGNIFENPEDAPDECIPIGIGTDNLFKRGSEEIKNRGSRK